MTYVRSCARCRCVRKPLILQNWFAPLSRSPLLCCVPAPRAGCAGSASRARATNQPTNQPRPPPPPTNQPTNQPAAGNGEASNSRSAQTNCEARNYRTCTSQLRSQQLQNCTDQLRSLQVQNFNQPNVTREAKRYLQDPAQSRKG